MNTQDMPATDAWSMLAHANGVVQAVMLLLALASFATWTILLAKTWELRGFRRRVEDASEYLQQSSVLPTAASLPPGVVQALVEAAWNERRHSAGLRERQGIKERTASRMASVERAWVRKLRHGTALLATIGSTAPFVGLFGTVWGIMNSFTGIARAHTTSLAVVAPGIAEALMATAIGLAAAIPAVIIYNHFTRSVGALRTAIADLSSRVMELVSRDLDRQHEAPDAFSQRRREAVP